MASYTVPHDPKMVHEAMCLAEGVISRQDVGVGRDVRYLQIISDFIKECERKRPLGPNGKHGNMHTAECGCEDVKWISVSNDNINHPFKAGGQAKTDILVDSHVFWPRDDDPDICKACYYAKSLHKYTTLEEFGVSIRQPKESGSSVDHPSHYNQYQGLEVIDLVEQMNFNRGNAVKYISRAGFKNSETELEDLEKAKWYLDREIQRLKETHEQP